MPWWAWILIAVGTVALVSGLAFRSQLGCAMKLAEPLATNGGPSSASYDAYLRVISTGTFHVEVVPGPVRSLTRHADLSPVLIGGEGAMPIFRTWHG
jgi:hypothetical protein